jgi:hypothetical protein
MKSLIQFLLLGALAPSLCWADVYVVTSVRNPLVEVSTRDLQNLYMGRKRALGGMEVTQPVDLPLPTPSRNAFYKAITGMEPAQVSSYWARLVFTGQTSPPVVKANEQALLAHLLQEPHAIGYISTPPKDERLKVLAILKESDS